MLDEPLGQKLPGRVDVAGVYVLKEVEKRCVVVHGSSPFMRLVARA